MKMSLINEPSYRIRRAQRSSCPIDLHGSSTKDERRGRFEAPCSAGFPVCGSTELSCPVFHAGRELATGQPSETARRGAAKEGTSPEPAHGNVRATRRMRIGGVSEKVGRRFPTAILRFVLLSFLWLGLAFASGAEENAASRFFDQGVAANQSGDFEQAFYSFSGSASAQPASGPLHNLGNSAWQTGHRGPAVLAWEQSLWLDPRNENARASLRYARHTGDLEEPDLRWFEVCSSWLPQQWWPWFAAASFWSCVSLLVVPPVFRRRRRDWFPAMAAAAAAVFLLCLPALAGLNSRAHLGFILPKEAALRVTPTAEAQILTYLPSGEPARLRKTRGHYALIRTRYSTGWVKQDELGLIGSGR